MNFDLDGRTARLGVGEFSDFGIGPRGSGTGASGLWRAQLGTHWHRELRARAGADNAATEFEVPVEGILSHRGWKLSLNGRIDQFVRSGERLTLREIKTVTRPLPDSEAALRADYPGYFIQLAAYAALLAIPGAGRVSPELLFVEAGSGLSQTVALGPADESLFRNQLERVAEFLDLRLRARERLRSLRFTPPFDRLRPGQEHAGAALESAIAQSHAAILLEAPTGFGKTGVLLEFALGQLRCGHFDRLIYVTSKSTGQLQVLRTLEAMTAPETPADKGPAGVAVWHVRPKSEHCVNHTFHCVREGCAYLDDVESRWSGSGLARFYLFEGQARDLESLRAAGQAAGICPYEITRASLAFNDVWVGDYNYVFSPSNRSLFRDQPGFDPARTLLIVDEAHNLAPRVADAFSQSFSAAEALAVRHALEQARASTQILLAWDEWARFLERLEPAARLEAGLEDEARSLLERLAGILPTAPLDFVALGPRVMELLWQVPAFNEQKAGQGLPCLWWCPRSGELAVACLDAAAAIGETLGEFGGVVLATATPGPVDAFSKAIGLDKGGPRLPSADSPPMIGDRLGVLTKRETRKLSPLLTSGAALLRDEETRAGAALCHVSAATPWRDGAYDVACDVRVDTTFRQRDRHQATTAATVEAMGRGAAGLAVFFPSYGYAEAIVRELAVSAPEFRASLQPRISGLSAQAAWIEESLASADAIFLVLGSSFAESIDLLGGRVDRALVVGPALPEVNPVQKAKLEALAGEGREAAFHRVYQIPGMQKVNQALGRLVRAPGQRARVLLHCRRFAEPTYAALLAPDLEFKSLIYNDFELAEWLRKTP